LPRLFTWRQSTGKLPPPYYILAHFMGHEVPERERPRETMNQAAERILGSFANPREVVSKSHG